MKKTPDLTALSTNKSRDKEDWVFCFIKTMTISLCKRKAYLNEDGSITSKFKISSEMYEQITEALSNKTAIYF